MMSFKSIRAKLILILIVILSITVFITLNISNRLIGDYHHKTQRASLNRAWSLANSLLTNIKTSVRNKAELIGVVPMLATVVENKDTATIKDIAEGYQNQLYFDFFDLYSLSGDLLHSLSEAPHQSTAIETLVESALDDEDIYMSFISLKGHLLYIAVTPIGVLDDPSGVLALGAAIDQHFIDQVKKQANVNLTILQQGAITLSTLSTQEQKELGLRLGEVSLVASAQGVKKNQVIGSNLIRVRTIKNITGEVVAHILIMHSLQESQSLLTSLQRSIIVGGMFTLIISLIIAYIFIRNQVISPIDRLVDFIFKIEKTGDVSQRFDCPNEDEISTVGLALNHLLDSQESLVSDLERSNRHLKIEMDERNLNVERIKRLSSAVEQSPASIIITDAVGNIEFVNFKFTQTTGYQPEEILGSNPTILNSNTTDPVLVSEMWEAIKEGKEWSGELENITKDKELYFDKVHLSPVKTPLNELSHFIIVSEDVTKQKNFQEELIRAKNDAQTANLAKSEFLANMSHEIRTPMNAVLGMTQLVLETELDTEQKELLSIALQAGESLLLLINDILDLSKIESGKFELLSEEFSLYNMLQNVSEVFEHQFQKKHVGFNLVIDPDVPKIIIGDITRIRQVLINLVGNANKFTEKGEVNITVKHTQGEENQITLEFQIQDTGIGMDETQIAKIFQSFTQVHSNKHKEYGGTGLGLSICKRLVKAMGGEIWANSKVGKGSCFFFSIKVQIHQNEWTNSQVGTTQTQLLKDKKILIVEDNLPNQVLIKSILIPTKCKVFLAKNGEEALTLLKYEAMDLVLMDIRMPIMSGIEATTRIRKDESFALNKHVPILAVTANAYDNDKKECLQVGMNEYITKPIKPKELLKSVYQFCDVELTS